MAMRNRNPEYNYWVSAGAVFFFFLFPFFTIGFIFHSAAARIHT